MDPLDDAANLLLTFRSVRNSPGKGNDIFDRAVALAVKRAAATGRDVRGVVIRLGYALHDAGTAEAQRMVLSGWETR